MAQLLETTSVTTLIVDDHRMLVELLTVALGESEDIEIVGTAGSAAEALTLVRRLRPQLVLLDQELPDATGLSVVAELKAASPSTRVLMLTSHTDSALLAEALEAGCEGYVTKRNGVDEIVSAVRAVAADQMPVSPDMVRALVEKPEPRVGIDLTERELEVLTGAVNGLTNKQIADQLYLSVNTVRNHMQRVLNKLGAHSKLEAASIAVRTGLVTTTS